MNIGETSFISGFDALSTPALEVHRGLEPEDNQAFGRYIVMHKVLVGRRGAEQLVGIADELNGVDTPDHLIAAGWAANEAALVLGRDDEVTKVQLLGVARNAWLKAIAHQRWINQQPDHPLIDDALEFRAAMDLAFMPVFNELVGGGVQNSTLRSVFVDVLNVAQIAGVKYKLAQKQRNIGAVGELRGFGYEVNAILAYNRRRSGKWFAMPASARADSGVHHSDQTHDILAVHQRRGEIIDAAPIEMKGYATKLQRARYKSLLVRSKLHIAVPGLHHADQVLAAITADYEGTASRRQAALVTTASQTIYDMVGQYLKGQPHHGIGSSRNVLRFRDKARVVARFPGLAVD